MRHEFRTSFGEVNAFHFRNPDKLDTQSLPTFWMNLGLVMTREMPSAISTWVRCHVLRVVEYISHILQPGLILCVSCRRIPQAPLTFSELIDVRVNNRLFLCDVLVPRSSEKGIRRDRSCHQRQPPAHHRRPPCPHIHRSCMEGEFPVEYLLATSK